MVGFMNPGDNTQPLPQNPTAGLLVAGPKADIPMSPSEDGSPTILVSEDKNCELKDYDGKEQTGK